MTTSERLIDVPDMEDGDEGDIDGALIPYARLKSFTDSSMNSVEIEVIFDEQEQIEKKEYAQNLVSNFFYDDKLLNSLSNGGVDNTSGSDDELEEFEKLAKSMVDLTDHGGVMKKIIKHGVGPNLTVGTTVNFHYSVFLEYGDDPIDSTFFRNKMTKAKIGDGSLLPGLDIALASMRLKEKAQFLLQPEYAFGKFGCPPRIPAAVPLLYEVRLEQAVDGAAADDHEAADWDWSQKLNAVTYQDRLAAARAYHRKGNNYYANNNLSRARHCYHRGVWLMRHAVLADDQQETTSHMLQAKLFSNMAQVCLDQKEPTRACTQCRMALELPFDMPPRLKAKVYFRYGVAKSLLNSFKDARKFFMLAQRLKPNCAAIARHLEQLTVSQRKYEAQERFIYKRMFAGSNDAAAAAAATANDDDNRVGRVLQDTPAAASTPASSNHDDMAGARGVVNTSRDDASSTTTSCRTEIGSGQRTTIHEGVTITELESDDEDISENIITTAVDDVRSGLCNLKLSEHVTAHENRVQESNSCDETCAGLSAIQKNLKPEFVRTVMAELDRLMSPGGRQKDVLFPCNLSADELGFIASQAEHHGFDLQYVRRGAAKHPKVVRSEQ